MSWWGKRYHGSTGLVGGAARWTVDMLEITNTCLCRYSLLLLSWSQIVPQQNKSATGKIRIKRPTEDEEWTSYGNPCWQNLIPNVWSNVNHHPIFFFFLSWQEALLDQAAIVFWTGAKMHQSANNWALQTQSTGLTLGYIFSKFIFIVCKLCLSDSKS